MISYVVAAITQFNTRNSNMIVLKARGRAIPKAFDVSEIMRSKFIQDLKVNDIQVVMEEVNHEDGSTSSEPFVETYMSR